MECKDKKIKDMSDCELNEAIAGGIIPLPKGMKLDTSMENCSYRFDIYYIGECKGNISKEELLKEWA